MEEEVTFTCPCCKSTLGLDDAGDLWSIHNALTAGDEEAGIKRGLGGLRVAEASPNWKQESYFHGQANSGKRGPTQLQPPSVAGARNQALAIQSEPVVMDDKLEAALNQDLSQRNLKLNITEDNDI